MINPPTLNLLEVVVGCLYHVFVANVGMTFGTLLFRGPTQIGAMGDKSAGSHSRRSQNMVTTTTGTVKGEFQAVFFRSAGPVVRVGVNIHVVYDITRAGDGLYRKKLKEITVWKMTIDTLSRKPFGVLAAVYCLLPRRPKGCHDMARDTKGVSIGGVDHEPGCQHRNCCQNNTNSHPEPPTLLAAALL